MLRSNTSKVKLSVVDNFYIGIGILGACFPQTSFLFKRYLQINNATIQGLLNSTVADHDFLVIPKYSLIDESYYGAVTKVISVIESNLNGKASNLGVIYSGYVPTDELDRICGEEGFISAIKSDFVLLNTNGVVKTNKEEVGLKLDLYTALMLFLLTDGRLLDREENKIDHGSRSLCLVCEGVTLLNGTHPVIFIGCGGDLNISTTAKKGEYDGTLDCSVFIL